MAWWCFGESRIQLAQKQRQRQHFQGSCALTRVCRIQTVWLMEGGAANAGLKQTISLCLHTYLTVTQGRQTFNFRRGTASAHFSYSKLCLAQMNGKTAHVCETLLSSVVKAGISDGMTAEMY